jgi:dihydroneopterin aldolase
MAMDDLSRLDGLVPDRLAPRTRKIVLEEYCLFVDIGFHDFEIGRLADGRRFNLQETLVREIYELVAARRGVSALRVSSRKPDIYPDCAGVGVELASF